MKHSLARIVKCTLSAAAIVACGASRAGATLISADIPGSSPPPRDTSLSTAPVDDTAANLFFGSPGSYLDILRFGGQAVLTTPPGRILGADGNPYFPSSFQSAGLTVSPGSPTSRTSVSTSALSAGWAPTPTSLHVFSPGQFGTITGNPEPSTVILLGTGLVGLIHRRMRRRATQTKNEASIEN